MAKYREEFYENYLKKLTGLKIRHGFYGEGIITAINGIIVTEGIDTVVKRVKATLDSENGVVNLGIEDNIFKFAEPLSESKAVFEEVKTAVEAYNKKLAEEENAALKKVAEERALAAVRRQRMALGIRLGNDFNLDELDTSNCSSYDEVERRWGIRRTGFGRGINVTEREIILISNCEDNTRFTYHDRYNETGDYEYSGEGSRGDQTMTGGNRAICDADNNGLPIHLYIKLGPTRYFYQGQMHLKMVEERNAPDADGNIRREYVFILEKRREERTVYLDGVGLPIR